MGLTQQPSAVATIQQVVNFLLVRGNLGRPGAGVCPVRGHSNVQGDRTMGICERVPGWVDRLDADRFGDEPVLIKKRVDNADVIVGGDRYENASHYLERHSCDLFILDDGFQHLQIARDLDIVIEAPGAAFYREGSSALDAADVLVPRRISLTVPAEVRGRKALAFAGLANTAQFFESIREAGLDVVATMTFPDHHRYMPRDLQAIDDTAAASGAEVIVTTEKDAVKLDRHDIIPIPADFVFDPAVIERVAALVRR